MVALVTSIAVSRKLTEEVAAPADAAAYSLAAMAAAVVAGPLVLRSRRSWTPGGEVAKLTLEAGPMARASEAPPSPVRAEEQTMSLLLLLLLLSAAAAAASLCFAYLAGCFEP